VSALDQHDLVTVENHRSDANHGPLGIFPHGGGVT
jgi:hypothetical protein